MPTLAIAHMSAPSTRPPPRRATPQSRQLDFIRAVAEHPDTAALRSHAHRNLKALAQELAYCADWDTLRSRPTWDVLGKRAAMRAGRSRPFSRSTVAKWLAWLRERGLIETFLHGSTPQYRRRLFRSIPGNRRSSCRLISGNLAAVYQLLPGDAAVDDECDDVTNQVTDLHVDETRAPSLGPRVARVQDARARPRSALRAVDETRAPPWDLHRLARTRAARLALVEQLQAESPPARATGPARRLRHLLRPWLLAGWTGRGLLHALDYRPDGSRWTYTWRSTSELRNPAGWLVHRLRAWLGADGRPLPDPCAVAEPRGRHAERRSEEDQGTRTGPILVAASDEWCEEHGFPGGLLWTGLPRCPQCRYREAAMACPASTAS